MEDTSLISTLSFPWKHEHLSTNWCSNNIVSHLKQYFRRAYLFIFIFRNGVNPNLTHKSQIPIQNQSKPETIKSSPNRSATETKNSVNQTRIEQ